MVDNFDNLFKETKIEKTTEDEKEEAEKTLDILTHEKEEEKPKDNKLKSEVLEEVEEIVKTPEKITIIKLMMLYELITGVSIRKNKKIIIEKLIKILEDEKAKIKTNKK